MDCYLDLRRPLGLGVVPLRIHLPTKATQVIIGRGSKADVFLYAGEHPSFVSREHAKLDFSPVDDKWTLSDLDSVNGMFYNSVKLGREERAVLNNGDRVYFGNPQHSFFVEYEFVAVSKTCESPESEAGSSVVDYGSDTSCASSTPPRALYCGGRPYGETAVWPDASAFATSTTTTTVLSPSHEDIPDDLWSCRIFKYLDMKELHSAGWTSRTWMARANACLDMLDTIRWKHPWSVDSLVQVLERKCGRSSHPVTAVITEGCYKVRDDHVERLARICGPSLTHVDFSGTPTVTPKGMRSIATHCPNLKTLVLRGCKRAGGVVWDWMDDLARNGTLEYCDLHCAGSNDMVVSKLAATSPNLKRVDLGVMCTEGVTDLGLYDLTERCQLLEHVDLRGCKRVTNRGITHLVQRCGQHLRTLVLHSCDIGDDAIRAIGQHCPSLEVLDVHRCIGVTDDGIMSLVFGDADVASSLKQLDLSNLAISDVALGHLARSGVKLTALDLRSCKSITGAGLSPLIKSIRKSLLKLDLNGCSKLRPVDVLSISRNCVGVLQELEIGAREDECESWNRAAVAEIRNVLGSTTRVHDAFDFPAPGAGRRS